MSCEVVFAPDFDGRKRPLSSPPLLGVSESKKNRLPSSSEHLFNLDRDVVSALIERKIVEFFEPPPCDHSDDLLWTGLHDPANEICSDPPPPPRHTSFDGEY